uniref:(northern house mosquito) hypothetical protein n=1 Tax=Culex pipiens TaxID=7175 RepID=A0A8D8NNK7_CULPI
MLAAVERIEPLLLFQIFNQLAVAGRCWREDATAGLTFTIEQIFVQLGQLGEAAQIVRLVPIPIAGGWCRMGRFLEGNGRGQRGPPTVGGPGAAQLAKVGFGVSLGVRDIKGWY